MTNVISYTVSFAAPDEAKEYLLKRLNQVIHENGDFGHDLIEIIRVEDPYDDRRHLTSEQIDKIRILWTRWNMLGPVEYNRFVSRHDLPPGWVSGWVGNSREAFPGTILVGISPEGEVSS